MVEGKERSTSKSRIESLSDLIFGLALSIGALILIGQAPSDFGHLIQSILFYAFSFLILISVWYAYTRTMSELRIETAGMVELNILLLFLVSIEPFLFNQLTSSSPLAESVSVLYALDLGGLFVIQAFLANYISSDKTRPDSIIQAYTLRRNTMIISSAFFFFSVLPFFWSLSIRVSGANIPLRTILWLIPMVLPRIRRLWERKLNSKTVIIESK